MRFLESVEREDGGDADRFSGDFEADLQVNGKVVHFSVDTGADVTVLSEDICSHLQLRVIPAEYMLINADGSRTNVLGDARVEISRGTQPVKTRVTVVSGANKNLLGKPEIRNLELLAFVHGVHEVAVEAENTNNRVHVTASRFDPVTEYAGLFSGLGTMPGIFNIQLKSGTEPMRLYAPRSIAAGLREKAKVELDRMLTMGVIEPVEEPTQWCSELTIAPKPNGSIRMCVDLTALNRGVKREVYPFPIVREMLSKLAEGKVFSKLDANSGFWQVQLDPGVQAAYNIHYTLGAVLLQEDAVRDLLGTGVLPASHGEDLAWLGRSHLFHG